MSTGVTCSDFCLNETIGGTLLRQAAGGKDKSTKTVNHRLTQARDDVARPSRSLNKLES